MRLRARLELRWWVVWHFMRTAFTHFVLLTDACEGCGAVATESDSDFVPLCKRCYVSLLADSSEPADLEC